MSKQRKASFALLSVLAALVVVSTAFVGVSIYAQTNETSDSGLTTTENETMNSEDNTTDQSVTSDNGDSETVTAADGDAADSGLTTFEEEALNTNEETTVQSGTSDNGDQDMETLAALGQIASTSGDCITPASDSGTTTSSSPLTSSDNQTMTNDTTTSSSPLTSSDNQTTSTGFSNPSFDSLVDNSTSAESETIGETSTTSSDCDVTVILSPADQSSGRTVLVNATGLPDNANVTVTAGSLVAGFTRADQNGTVLFALGISDEMSGSTKVTVQDEDGNIGSAMLTVTAAPEEPTPNTNTAGNNTQQSPTNTTNTTGNFTSNFNDNGTSTQSGQNSATGNMTGTANTTSTASNTTSSFNGTSGNTQTANTTSSALGNFTEGITNATSNAVGNITGAISNFTSSFSGSTNQSSQNTTSTSSYGVQ